MLIEFPTIKTYINLDAKSIMTAIRVSRRVFKFHTVGRIPVASIMSVTILTMMYGYCTLP
jgi:hypothetical protein